MSIEIKKIDVVINIGGSILQYPKELVKVCNEIRKISNKGYKVVIVPGGGKLVDDIRKMFHKYSLSNDLAHWMAIKAMDINGILIASLNEKLHQVNSASGCREILEDSKIPVFLTYDVLVRDDNLPKSWNVTSDSISLYIANILETKYNILVKDVEGIYDKNNNIIENITPEELESLSGETCVDNYLSELLRKIKIPTYVISGKHPFRIRRVLENKLEIGTEITFK